MEAVHAYDAYYPSPALMFLVYSAVAASAVGALAMGFWWGAKEGWRRWAMRIGCDALLIGMGALAIFVLALPSLIRSSGYSPVRLFAVGVALTLLALAIGKIARFFARVWTRASALHMEETPGREQDRQMILGMLREGKVSAAQAAELLQALGPKTGSADGLPLTRPMLGAVAGAVLVVIGFMLPWSHVNLGHMLESLVASMPVPAFGPDVWAYVPRKETPDVWVTGYNMGLLGWLILIAGVLPALIVCIPALDKHVRQGMLRLVIALIGGAFVVSLLVSSPQGPGLWVAAAGFALQLVTGIRQGAWASAPERA